MLLDVEVQFLDELRIALAETERRRVGVPRSGEQRTADALPVLDQAVDLSHQVLGGERLFDVGVGAVLQSADLVLDRGLRRELDDGNVAVTQFRLDVFAQFIAVHLGHHDVAHDQIAVVVGEDAERYFAVGGRQHLVAGADDLGDDRPQIIVILHDQYLAGSRLFGGEGRGGDLRIPAAVRPGIRAVRRAGRDSRGIERNLHGEHSPAPLAVGAHDASAVLDRKQASQRQPDTGSALAVARLVEGVENTLHIFGNDALPVVGNRDAKTIIPGGESHAAFASSVFQRIGQQIVHDLRDGVAVNLRHHAGLDVPFEADAADLRGRTETHAQFIHQFRNVARLHRRRVIRLFGLAQIEQLVDHLQQIARVLFHDAEVIPHPPSESIRGEP